MTDTRDAITATKQAWRAMIAQKAVPENIRPTSKLIRDDVMTSTLYDPRLVTLDRAWRNFDTFVEQMGAIPAPGFVLNRIDMFGPYNAANCAWMSRSAAREYRPTFYRRKGTTKRLKELNDMEYWRAPQMVNLHRVQVTFLPGTGLVPTIWVRDTTLDPDDHYRLTGVIDLDMVNGAKPGTEPTADPYLGKGSNRDWKNDEIDPTVWQRMPLGVPVHRVDLSTMAPIPEPDGWEEE